MFTVPVYIAILTGRRISDVLQPYETEPEARAQCQRWTRKTPALVEEHVPGLIYFATYGTADDTVRIERHMLELAEQSVPDENDDEPLLHLNLCPTALKEVDA